MIKYYTRACNFYYGQISIKKIKNKEALPLNGNRLISFDTIQLITRKNKQLIKIKDIKKLRPKLKIKIFEDLKKITKVKKIQRIKFKNYPLLMGILNTTPDSFSDGGKYLKNKSANKQILKLKKEGVDIIDIGGESTRPNSITIDEKTEWKRVKSKIKFEKRKRMFVSLDTRKSFVLEKSLPLKIDLINDVSGLSYDPETINYLKKTKKPFVIHHMNGTPKNMQIKPIYKNVLLDIYDFFETKLKYLRKQGIKHNNIILDPGIGFGKNLKHNITLLKNISIFHSLGLPIMLGLSRKRFIKDISKENDTKDRIGGTISSCIQAYLQGVQILRVHDVQEINQAFKVFRELQN